MEQSLVHETTQRLSSALSMHTFTPYSESTIGARLCSSHNTTWLARERLLGISDTEYIARRAPGGARVAFLQLREILRPEDVQKTLMELTQENLRHVHKVAVPRHTTDRADLAY